MVFFPFASRPYMKAEPFLDSLRVSFRFGLFIICFLKFCRILDPFSFFYFESAIMASSSFRRRNWLTFNLNDISLSNSSPSCPVLIPIVNLICTLKEIKHGRILAPSRVSSFNLRHNLQELIEFNFSRTIQVDS